MFAGLNLHSLVEKKPVVLRSSATRGSRSIQNDDRSTMREQLQIIDELVELPLTIACSFPLILQFLVPSYKRRRGLVLSLLVPLGLGSNSLAKDGHVLVVALFGCLDHIGRILR